MKTPTTTTAAKYQIQVTHGAGWQSFGATDDPDVVAVRLATARRTGYKARVIDRNGEILSLFYGRDGRPHLVTIPE
jgi:hypothetical protein